MVIFWRTEDDIKTYIEIKDLSLKPFKIGIFLILICKKKRYNILN